jgi:hypothetical protein
LHPAPLTEGHTADPINKFFSLHFFFVGCRTTPISRGLKLPPVGEMRLKDNQPLRVSKFLERLYGEAADTLDEHPGSSTAST